MKKEFYVDTCIWLNLFKKEGDNTKGVPYWKIAEEFIAKIIRSNDIIIYTGFILKELKYKLNPIEYVERENFLKNESSFKFIKAKEEDYDLARKFEKDSNYEISFFDCIHLAISIRKNCTLITRDNDFIKFAKKYIKVHKPEGLIT
ncbi:hypothetical protein C0585_08010 [Candidatus Woesearchaeota archaeon]|nr:MAG: hypothetical protein C0585_08010 [Candidatus Woesearchaeota archaeon]